MNLKQLAAVVDELIEALQLQAAELDKLLTHIQQVSPRMGYTNEMPAVVAALKKVRLEMDQLLKQEAA